MALLGFALRCGPTGAPGMKAMDLVANICCFAIIEIFSFLKFFLLQVAVLHKNALGFEIRLFV